MGKNSGNPVMCENKRIHDECEGGIEISIPWITDWHHEACGVMTNGDHKGRIFLSHPHTNNRFFFITHFILVNMKKTSRKSRICGDATW